MTCWQVHHHQYFWHYKEGNELYMAEIPLALIHQPSSQGSNSHSLSPTHNYVVGYSSPQIISHEISYQHLCSIYPITR